MLWSVPKGTSPCWFYTQGENKRLWENKLPTRPSHLPTKENDDSIRFACHTRSFEAIAPTECPNFYSAGVAQWKDAIRIVTTLIFEKMCCPVLILLANFKERLFAEFIPLSTLIGQSASTWRLPAHGQPSARGNAKTICTKICQQVVSFPLNPNKVDVQNTSVIATTEFTH